MWSLLPLFQCMRSHHAVVVPEETSNTVKPSVTFSGLDVTEGTEFSPSPDMKSSIRGWSPPRSAGIVHTSTRMDVQSPDASPEQIRSEGSPPQPHSSETANHNTIKLSGNQKENNSITNSAPSFPNEVGSSSPENRRLSGGMSSGSSISGQLKPQRAKSFRFEISLPAFTESGSGKTPTVAKDSAHTPHSATEAIGILSQSGPNHTIPSQPTSQSLSDGKSENKADTTAGGSSPASKKSFVVLPKYFESLFRPPELQTPTREVMHALRRTQSERYVGSSRPSSRNVSPDRVGNRTLSVPGTPSSAASDVGKSTGSGRQVVYFEDSRTEVFENGHSNKSKSSAATPVDMLNYVDTNNVTVNFGLPATALEGGSVSGASSQAMTPPALRRGASVRSFRSVRIPRIDWDDLEIPSSALEADNTAGSVVHTSAGSSSSGKSVKNKSGKSGNESDPVIGKGSFGSVIRAILHHEDAGDNGQGVEVVVKVMTKSVALSTRDVKQDSGKDKDKILRQAISEVSTIIDAESRINYKDCITKVYGICEGPLPEALCRALRVLRASDAVGIVMRYEGGGTLHSLIHSKDITKRPTVVEKLRLLTGIARALAELHTATVIHGDIKPENVLLSTPDTTANPAAVSEIRLADFGLAHIQDNSSATASAIRETANFRGTPLYAAPEMLVNPYSDEVDGKLARASRRTDMYAFAILCWEVLAGMKPFSDISNSTLLASKVHQGFRPSLEMLPKEVPMKVVQMIQACWDADRDKRKTAIECYSILKRYYENMSKTPIDVYLTTFRGDTTIAPSVLKFLEENEVKVHFGGAEFSSKSTAGSGNNQCSVVPSIGTSTSASMSNATLSTNPRYPEVSRSKLVVAIITQNFQDDQSGGMKQLKEARKANRSIVPLFLEPNYQSWHSQDLVYYCQLRSSSLVHFDLSSCVTTTTPANESDANDTKDQSHEVTSKQWKFVDGADSTFETRMHQLLAHIRNLEV